MPPRWVGPAWLLMHTHIHTHIHIYTHIYICVLPIVYIICNGNYYPDAFRWKEIFAFSNPNPLSQRHFMFPCMHSSTDMLLGQISFSNFSEKYDARRMLEMHSYRRKQQFARRRWQSQTGDWSAVWYVAAVWGKTMMPEDWMLRWRLFKVTLHFLKFFF